MEQNKKRKTKRSSTKIIPPKKKKTENLSRDEVRSINKKKIRRKRKAKRIAMLAGLALVVICVGIALVLAVFFKIGSVQIKGDKAYADSEVVARSGIELGSNLFLVDEEKLSTTLTNALPYIKSVRLERDLPDTVIITVKATREVAAIPYNAGFILVDETGKVLDRDSSMIRDGVAIVSGVQLKGAPEGGTIKLNNDDVTSDFIELLQAVKESGIQPLTEINYTKDGDFELKYDGRITLKLGAFENVVKKLRLAIVAIEKENAINAYSVGVLDLGTEPYAYFSAGEDKEVKPTKVPETDAQGKDDESTQSDAGEDSATDDEVAGEDDAQAPDTQQEDTADTD